MADRPNLYLDHEQPHWRHVVRKREYIAPERTLNPLTWIRRGTWDVIAESEFRA